MSICGFVFLVTNLAGLADPARLSFSWSEHQVLPQIVTYMFVHHDLGHLAANVIGLWVFGRSVERSFGAARFLALFGLAGVIAALAQGAADGATVLSGASGAIAGVMAAFLRVTPFARIYLFGVFPMPAWLLVLLWLVYNILGVQQHDSTVAFVAHLAGFAAGLGASFLLVRPRYAIEEFD